MNLSKLLRAALKPSYWPVLRHAVLPTIEHKAPLSHVNPATVIDVGANKGQFSAFADHQWPNSQIFGFEPIADQAKKYRRVMGRRAILYEMALGARDDEMSLHLASRADSSSLLPLGNLQKEIFGMKEVGTIKVPVRRLDDILQSSNLAGSALLKIDVQGFELEVLKGSTRLLDMIEWIYVESSFVELYEGQAKYDEISDMLEGLGYRLIGKFNVAKGSDGQNIQADCLFEKSRFG